ncbi:uncharacterized protein LOC126374703 [Pectinophora gossypiella]|uniref:uncharacterized protein LOC126374703 n=1 Tax=Pectinophora gossypiella TaxID=13191 RepID=UPI00214E9BDB|nr:uncharacterized protein LOC126374703 [Pectinophora gossypiella]
MYYKCCVCKSSRQDAVLHHFPCTEKRLNKWLKCLEDQVNLKDTPRIELSKLFVCQKHFERKFVTAKSHLLGKAYPSLFTEEEIVSGIPSNKNLTEIPLNQVHKEDGLGGISYEPIPRQSEGSIKMSKDNLSGNTSVQARVKISDIKEDRLGCITLEPIPGPSGGCTVNTPVQTTLQVSGSVKLRKRVISKVKDLTPMGQKIYDAYQKAKRQADYFQRAKDAAKFSKGQAFEELTKNLNPYATKIILMQTRLCTKRKKGRRFTTEEKMIALAIMKQSPKGYRFLHRIFILPSKTTLNKMIEKLSIHTGISSQVTGLIKKEVGTWNERKKLCTVIFDEMSLDTALIYNRKQDTITGFVELKEKKRQFADHALVFMLRGAVYKWQQPISFYFCQGATSGVELKIILKDIIAAVVECGLKPIAISCDQGSTFQSTLSSLRQDTRRDQLLADVPPDGTVTINDVKLSIIYDPPHLIKGIRNNFLNKNITIDGKISKWSDIVDVYKTDCEHTEARLLHNLTDQHVIPEKIKKMKVKNCVKVFSSTVSAALSYTAKFSHYADGKPVSDTLKNTAETVLFLDKLFDSVNGAATGAKAAKKPLRLAVTENSQHHDFWREAIQHLKKMKFVDGSGKEKSVPSIKNFITTLESYMRLWQILKGQGVKLLRPRFFSSDPIENFFGQVRAYNYRNNDPNCHSFQSTFKSLLITRFLQFHKDTFNCEDDPANPILNLKQLFNEKESSGPGHSVSSIEKIVEQARRERINMHSWAFTAGWVVRKLQLSCDVCKKSFTSDENDLHEWISHREFSKNKNRLCYPSEGAVRCFGAVISETNEYLENNGHNNNILQNIKSLIVSKYSFDFINCTEHRSRVLEKFIIITIRFSVMNWCNVINRILKGTDLSRLKKNLPPMQEMALKKYCKKLKNKSFNK